jgi:hypothetical protein
MVDRPEQLPFAGLMSEYTRFFLNVASPDGAASRGFAGALGMDEEYLMIVFATSVKNRVGFLPLTANPPAWAN